MIRSLLCSRAQKPGLGSATGQALFPICKQEGKYSLSEPPELLP
jgi:hypothetical protein